jgi:hypothetical protein
MTRFKELERIEAAIEHRNKSELHWALDYCRIRLQIAPRKEHTKYWHGSKRKCARLLGQKLKTIPYPQPYPAPGPSGNA